MKRLIMFVLWLYPPAWRRRYRDELEALIEDSGPDWRAVADLLKESIKMQLTAWNFGKLAGVLGLAGVVLAGVTSMFIPNGYISEAELKITPPPGSTSEHATERLMQMENQILSRNSLKSIVEDPRLDLYATERKSLPLENVIDQMRERDIEIRVVSLRGSAADAFIIRFRNPDRVKAQRTVQALITRFQDENLKPLRFVLRDSDYFVVLDPPTIRPQGIMWFSLPVWLRPDFTARAELKMIPGAASGDRQQLLGRIKRVQSEVLSRTSLAGIIQDPRLELYEGERRSKPLEEVIGKMKANILIAADTTDPLAFTISFRYPDSRRAHDTVQALMSKLMDLNFTQHDREAMRQNPPMVASELMTLDVLDPPRLPVKPVWPNRYLITLNGLVAGVALAVLIRLLARLGGAIFA